MLRSLRGEDVTAEARTLYADSRSVDDQQFRAVGSFALLMDSLIRGETAEVIRLAREATADGLAGLDHLKHGARAAIWSGDVATARELLDAAPSAPRGRREHAMVATIESGIAMLEGRTADARTLTEEARRLARDIGAKTWVGLIDLDAVITGALEPDERRRAADEAREIFTDLRAPRLLARLDEALEQTRTADRGSGERSARSQEARQHA
jgi:hypothetical protein